MIGSTLASYAAGYERTKDTETRQYVIERLVSFGLFIVACLIITQGVYLRFSAATYSSAGDIRVMPVVIPELKLGNVERHVFGAHCGMCRQRRA